MPQFDVYVNTNPASNAIYPYIIDVQSPLLDTLETRLVIPLISKSKFNNKAIKNLTPEIMLKGKEYLILTPQIAAIRKSELGKLLENCTLARNEIISSIDFLITGF